MNTYDDGDQGYLYAVDARIRDLRTRLARNPNPRDPEYDQDAADALEEIEREQKVALREFELNSLCLNEFMVSVRKNVGLAEFNQLDNIRYELAKALETA